jgi:hypothetical protein
LKSSDLVKWINEFICSRGRHHNTHVFKIGVHKGSQWAVLNATVVHAGVHKKQHIVNRREEMRNKHVILLRSTPATGVCRPNLPNIEPKAP